MYVSETCVKVRYAETDQMGVVHHGNYAMYYEIGRSEALVQLGYSYKEMEAEGWKMPVVHLESKFKKSAHYDDLLTIKTIIPSLPGRIIVFETYIYRQEVLLHEASVSLVFLNDKNKLVSPPAKLLNLLHPYFQD